MTTRTPRKSVLLFALLLAACAASPAESSAERSGGAPAPAVAVHPVSGLAVVPLTVRSGGKVHRFQVEVARTSEEQATGLMFRQSMGAYEGMVFPMNPARVAAFWMKNTFIPLDIIYVGPDGRITNIAANAVPHSLQPLESAGLVKGVLELNGGRAAELGIGPGDRVDW